MPRGGQLRVASVLEATDAGLFCRAGGFHVDPASPVPVAVVTHAHSDHARPGSGRYLCAASGAGLLRRRVGPDAVIEPVPFGQRLELGGAAVSFHPAGHILGSAQVRVDVGGEVWVASGDYKREPDPTCEAFEVVPCEVFITEATFALPCYAWRPAREVAGEMLAWWGENAAAGRASVLFCYTLGKAQRVLAELAVAMDGEAAGKEGVGSGKSVTPLDREVLLHGAMEAFVGDYRAAGVRMLPTRPMGERVKGESFAGRLVLAPPSAGGSPWMRRFGAGPDFDTGFASGWMRVRGIRRRLGYDRGFAISDHADWDDLLRTVRETGARKVLTTHGYTDALARYLREQGLDSTALATPAGGDEED